MLEERARKNIKKASDKRNKKNKRNYRLGFEYKDRNW